MLASLRQRLLKQQAELHDIRESGDQAAATVELDQTRVGRLSRMDALQGQAMAQAARQRRETELRKITAALRRLDDDDYGYCADCGEEIAAGRLQVDPSATLCIRCAEQQDR